MSFCASSCRVLVVLVNLRVCAFVLIIKQLTCFSVDAVPYSECLKYGEKCSVVDNKNEWDSEATCGDTSKLTSQTVKLATESNNYEYPCPSLDKDCIIKYFHDHARHGCQVPPPQPKNGLVVKRSDIYLALLNSTVHRYNISAAKAMDAEITAFFVDIETEYTILTLTYKNLIVTIDKAAVFYYRTAKPPIYTSVNSTTVLERLDLTVYFNGVGKIDLEDSLTYAAVSGSNSMTRTTPTIESYKGSDFELLFSTVANNYAGYVQELEAPPQALAFSGFYIQHQICNFGLDVE